MNTKELKEVMDFLENTIYLAERDDLSLSPHKAKYNSWIRETIKLLQRGEKYEKMFKEIRKDYYQITLTENNAIVSIGKKMDDIEQRYFPKQVKKKITININKLRSELIEMNEKLLKKYFPIEDDEINEFDFWKKED